MISNNNRKLTVPSFARALDFFASLVPSSGCICYCCIIRYVHAFLLVVPVTVSHLAISLEIPSFTLNSCYHLIFTDC
jgi:hypothetical protein